MQGLDFTLGEITTSPINEENYRQHVALRVSNIVGGDKLVARGHVLVGHRLGDALAHGVVVEVEVGLAAVLGADHVRDLAGHRPFDLRYILALVLNQITHLIVVVVVGSTDV